eukprot:767122-Hanusia_phi.AAC.2
MRPYAAACPPGPYPLREARASASGETRRVGMTRSDSYKFVTMRGDNEPMIWMKETGREGGREGEGEKGRRRAGRAE